LGEFCFQNNYEVFTFPTSLSEVLLSLFFSILVKTEGFSYSFGWKTLAFTTIGV
jgi:hypothetical protein